MLIMWYHYYRCYISSIINHYFPTINHYYPTINHYIVTLPLTTSFACLPFPLAFPYVILRLTHFSLGSCRTSRTSPLSFCLSTCTFPWWIVLKEVCIFHPWFRRSAVGWVKLVIVGERYRRIGLFLFFLFICRHGSSPFHNQITWAFQILESSSRQPAFCGSFPLWKSWWDASRDCFGCPFPIINDYYPTILPW